MSTKRRAELVKQIRAELAGEPLRLETLSLGSLLNILADLKGIHP